MCTQEHQIKDVIEVADCLDDTFDNDDDDEMYFQQHESLIKEKQNEKKNLEN